MCTKQYLTVYKFLYLFPGLQTPVLPIFEAVLKKLSNTRHQNQFNAIHENKDCFLALEGG